MVSGFNSPNRIILAQDVRPGQQFQIAVFGINGPISASPENYVWMRTATLDFYSADRARVDIDVPFEIVRSDSGLDAKATPERQHDHLPWADRNLDTRETGCRFQAQRPADGNPRLEFRTWVADGSHCGSDCRFPDHADRISLAERSGASTSSDQWKTDRS